MFIDLIVMETVMDAKVTNPHFLSDDDKRRLRAGYYAKENKYLDENTLQGLSNEQVKSYIAYKKPIKTFAGEAAQTLLGLVVFLGMITSPIWISQGWEILFGNDNNSNTSSSVISTDDSDSKDNAESFDSSDFYDSSDSDSDSDTSYTGDASDTGDCNPNYSPCISDAGYDLDCADVGFTVEVVGVDEYRLDRDGDGYGCETY